MSKPGTRAGPDEQLQVGRETADYSSQLPISIDLDPKGRRIIEDLGAGAEAKDTTTANVSPGQSPINLPDDDTSLLPSYDHRGQSIKEALHSLYSRFSTVMEKNQESDANYQIKESKNLLCGRE